MDQRISLITLVVDDVAASRRFYIDGLAWRAEFEAPGEVLMIRVGERLLLSLWDRAHAEEEIGAVTRGGTPPVTLAHNVAEPAQVDAVLAQARTAGATAVVAAQQRAWGGYSGYFADPDGFRWEVAVNPSPLGESLLP
ncbi:VOC family protein [Microbacterium sp. JZ37]|uniref:VOC family protein n=1 Tax=Microbacterium sp. JZ37 TaxID=2654193 RepID=UPI002B480AA5|nr:VOC family protein [Microbacterium sp. JZ37]WRH17608.1 glyoxalase [Microbacterium sp. JZ37]